jgi:hypothetical protein
MHNFEVQATFDLYQLKPPFYDNEFQKNTNFNAFILWALHKFF